MKSMIYFFHLKNIGSLSVNRKKEISGFWRHFGFVCFAAQTVENGHPHQRKVQTAGIRFRSGTDEAGTAQHVTGNPDDAEYRNTKSEKEIS